MMPWVDFSSERVFITVNKDFLTKRHRDRNKGLSYFARLGDDLVGGSCVLDGGRRCDRKEVWYVMDGYVYPHWTEFWVPEEEGGVRFTVVVYCKGGGEGAPEGLPMPPGLTARALCVPCGPGHLTVGCTCFVRACELFSRLRSSRSRRLVQVEQLGSQVSR